MSRPELGHRAQNCNQNTSFFVTLVFGSQLAYFLLRFVQTAVGMQQWVCRPGIQKVW